MSNVTSQTVSNLISGQIYYFSVTAYDSSNNESGFSNEVSGTPKDPAQSYHYTVATNPPKFLIVVDGATYTAPKTFSWAPGSSHNISVPSPQGEAGSRNVFSSWSDGGDQNHTVAMPLSDANCTASFKTQYSLTSSTNPSEGVAIIPSGLNWYDSGQTVTLSAIANAGYSFSYWTGDLTGSANSGSLTMNGPKNVAANFIQNQYTLMVNMNPSGSGSVIKNPEKATYVYGEQVTLTATANSGYNLSNWSGDISSTNRSVTLTMNSNQWVMANFIPDPANSVHLDGQHHWLGVSHSESR